MQETDTELTQWRGEAAEREQRAHQVESRSEDWNAWADGRINTALEQHGNALDEAIGVVIAEIRADLRVEFRKELEAATAKLGVEQRELIAGLRTELGRLETEFARRPASFATETGGLHLRGAYR